MRASCLKLKWEVRRSTLILFTNHISIFQKAIRQNNNNAAVYNMQKRLQTQIRSILVCRITDSKWLYTECGLWSLHNKSLIDTPSCQSLGTNGLQPAPIWSEDMKTVPYCASFNISSQNAVNNFMWTWCLKHLSSRKCQNQAKVMLHIPENAFCKLMTKCNKDAIFQLQLGVHLGRNLSGNITSDWVDTIGFYGGWQSLSAGSRQLITYLAFPGLENAFKYINAKLPIRKGWGAVEKCWHHGCPVNPHITEMSIRKCIIYTFYNVYLWQFKYFKSTFLSN